MSVEIWVAFVLAAMVLLIPTGPTMTLVVSQAIAHGRKAVIPLVGGVTLFKSAFIVTALNPKSIAFFVAFLPQFVSAQSDAFPQFLLFGGGHFFFSPP